ncbi:unnamed protein product [Caenorhabditis auriculariae]|uniref:Uncharacterized protein n=1 Tax=Caenorhabditis auriculariae TaxID=2777116 RepID=A0A8S1HDZ0_9PELO|nr:unnamed protein product [Caenorhabditis auriculariae]
MGLEFRTFGVGRRRSARRKSGCRERGIVGSEPTTTAPTTLNRFSDENPQVSFVFQARRGASFKQYSGESRVSSREIFFTRPTERLSAGKLNNSSAGLPFVFSEFSQLPTMGNGMNKYSRCDDYYKRRRKPDERGSNFSKEYSEYWRNDKKKSVDNNFERNEFSFSPNSDYESPLRNSRKHSSFVSSFDNSRNFNQPPKVK